MRMSRTDMWRLRWKGRIWIFPPPHGNDDDDDDHLQMQGVDLCCGDGAVLCDCDSTLIRRWRTRWASPLKENLRIMIMVMRIVKRMVMRMEGWKIPMDLATQRKPEAGGVSRYWDLSLQDSSGRRIGTERWRGLITQSSQKYENKVNRLKTLRSLRLMRKNSNLLSLASFYLCCQYQSEMESL